GGFGIFLRLHLFPEDLFRAVIRQLLDQSFIKRFPLKLLFLLRRILEPLQQPISERGLISAPQLPSHPPAGNKPEDQDRERIGGHNEKKGQQPDEEPVRSRGCGGRMGVRRVRGLEGRAADVSRAGGWGPSRGRRHGPLRRVVPSGGCRKRGLRRVRSRTDWSV